MDLDLLNDFRRTVEDQLLGETRFTLFPRDALEKRGNLSVLLRADFRLFDVRLIPKAILLRSPRLRGGLRVTHVKHYNKDDFSRNGSCKEGWRLVLLQGCPTFMESLTNYEQDHKFPLGPGHIILRGGPDRPKSTANETHREGAHGRPAWGGRGRGAPPPPTNQNQPKHQQKRPGRGRDQERDMNRESERSRHYDRDFPKYGTGRGRTSARERNRESGLGENDWSFVSRGGS